MLKKCLSILIELKENTVRFWHWRDRENDSQPRISETVTKEMSVDEIATLAEITLRKIDFKSNNEISARLPIKNKVFIKCIFAKRTIESYIFIGCSFRECSFNGAKIVGVEFHKCVFFDCMFYKTKFTSTYLDPDSLRFSSRWYWNWANINAWLFQSLYRNSKDMHQEVFAMRADRRFQFYRRYEYLRGQNPRPRKFIVGFLFDWLLGYGYGIKNALFVTLAMVVGFAYIIEGHFKEGGSNFLKALYFSVVSFTTTGFGDITPKLEVLPISITIIFLLFSVAWCAIVTAIIVKRIVK